MSNRPPPVILLPTAKRRKRNPRCYNCSETFASLDDFIEHLVAAHKQQWCYPCNSAYSAETVALYCDYYSPPANAMKLRHHMPRTWYASAGPARCSLNLDLCCKLISLAIKRVKHACKALLKADGRTHFSPQYQGTLEATPTPQSSLNPAYTNTN